MSQTITIHTELAQEDRERIDLLIELLSVAHLDKEDAAKKQAPAPAPVEPEAPAAPAEEPAEDPAPAEEEPQPQYTADDVRALAQRLLAPATGKRDATKKIVNEYAAKVGDIPADKYAEVMTRLQALLEG